MKFKVLILTLLIVPIIACVSKGSADKLEAQKDSLSMAIATKDSVINEIFLSLGGITENLNEIKQRENLISTSISGSEIKKHQTTQINEDIQAINDLLIKNKETIANLEKSVGLLKKANVKIGSLEKLVRDLTTQIDAKNADIAQLQTQLESKHIEVAQLTGKVTNLSSKVDNLEVKTTELSGEVKSKSDMLNTAYYIVGSQKELLAKGIVSKSGFIGRTLKVNENRSMDTYTTIDVRNFDEVLIGHKNITVVTSHSSDSYEFVMDEKGVYASLVITNKTKFWSASKVLVLSYK